MIKHYLLISWRNMYRNRFYTIILVVGLAIGVTASLLLAMYTWHELSFDNFQKNKERIFLVGVDSKEGAEINQSGWTTPPTGPAMKEFFPEVEASARLCFWFDDVVAMKADKQYIEKKLIGADSSIFEILTIPFIAGDAETALVEPHSIVITESAAKKYFGSENALGQTIQFDHFFATCTVTGVVKDYPENSHFDFDILLSLSTLKAINFDFNNSWTNHTFSTYVLLNQKAHRVTVENKFPQFVEEHLGPYFKQRFQKSYHEIYKQGDFYKLFLTPVTDVHLSTLIFDNREGKKMLTFVLAFIGVIILLLVTINYTNLATVLSFSRAKEVGIRKAAGSGRRALFSQFIVESILMAFFGLTISLGLVEIFLPYFNNLIGEKLSLPYGNPLLIAGFVAFGITLGLLAGLYPALTFSSFTPIKALKGRAQMDSDGAWMRNALVIFQFSVCIVMIVSTLVVFKQLSFMSNKNVGFDKDQVVVIKRVEGLKSNKATFKNELLKYKDIGSVSYSETTPGGNFNGHGQHFEGTPLDESPTIYPLVADEDILETLNLKLSHGKDFRELKTKNPKAILNQSAVNTYNLQNPTELSIDRGTMGIKDVDVIGVVKDFHFKSFHYAVEPLVIYQLNIEDDSSHRASFALVKINGQNISATLKHIERVWRSQAMSYPFEYSFLDKDFEKLFERERMMTRVYTIFSVIAISIACLGLLGSASYLATKRTKEIGIRKIVGASTENIALLLSREFLKWILLSILIGSGISWFIMRQWLQNFAFQTELAWWIFALAGLTIVSIAFLTIGWHLYKSASRNPVETLRHD